MTHLQKQHMTKHMVSNEKRSHLMFKLSSSYNYTSFNTM